MKARIHRGAHEVGGNCIELEAGGARLVLDLGFPITAPRGKDVPLPGVAGLDGGDRSLAGIALSHPHVDHYGLLPKVAPSVPLYMGEAARRILAEAAFFGGGGLDVEPAGFLRHRRPLEIGPFRVTPFLNDHSAFDAYSLLVESGGRALFYTGDIRAHGRKRKIFEQLLRRPPGRVDVLLMEGTHVGHDSDPAARGPSEEDVEAACLETFRATRGLALALFSPQNVDRLVSVYKAAVKSGRDLVIDLYTAAIAAATGLDTIPQPGWKGVRVYLPRSQRRKVLLGKAFHRTDAVKASRIYPEELAARAGEIAMVFRQSMARELEAAKCLAGARAVWSMWQGYLRDPSGRELQAFLGKHGIPLVVHHSSGHAFIPDLQRLARALAPRRIVPIHSFAGDRFAEFFPRVDRQPDGAWWEV